MRTSNNHVLIRRRSRIQWMEFSEPTGGAYLWWSPSFPQGIAALNAEVTRQAAIIAYVNDFKLLFIVSLLMLLLLLMMSWSKGNAGAVELSPADANRRSTP